MEFVKELEKIIDYINIEVQIDLAMDSLTNKQLEKINNYITFAFNKAREKVEEPK